MQKERLEKYFKEAKKHIEAINLFIKKSDVLIDIVKKLESRYDKID